MSTDNADAIASGVERGVKNSRLKLTDRRLLVLFLFIVAIGIATTLWQQHQTDQVKHAQHAAQIVCQQTNATNTKINSVLDQLYTNATNTTSLTPTQKTQARLVYQSLHLAIVDCSKLAGG